MLSFENYEKITAPHAVRRGLSALCSQCLNEKDDSRANSLRIWATSMKTGHSKRKEVDNLRQYYNRLEVLIQDCLENEEFRMAWGIIRAEARITHPSRKFAELAGLACIRGLGAAFDGVGFAVRQARSKAGWRIRFFVTDHPI
jgi:hypothetical protein